MKKLLNLLKGKKTYFIALCAVVYGIYVSDAEIVLVGLGLIGLRDGVTTEVTKVLIKKK